MKEKWYYLLYLIWFSYLVMSAIIMFGNGFLLSRKTLNDITHCVPLTDFDCEGRQHYSRTPPLCSDEEKLRRILAKPDAPLICLPQRNRVVFMLIDALRYDFTVFNKNDRSYLPYQNRLPVIHKLLKEYPNRTRLYRFLADPPTTTLQRVKALITGSLPTFVDASSNFAAMELKEDNVINQLVQDGGHAVLLGDDTWSRLLPKHWLRSEALYSFHTWDLDTVDNAVESKIYEEIQKQDWDLLLCHYLGVDHAGHRYGPNHPEMTRKLDELNSRIQKVVGMLPSDVLLYVVGDHGMTETGDHGGETKAERTAAFFAYRGEGLQTGTESVGSEVQQTDFAHTLSVALGRPPPAPSLGNLLLSALPPSDIQLTLVQLTNGLKQITKYMLRYGEESQQVSLEKLASYINSTRDMVNKATQVKTEADLQNFVTNVRSLVEDIRSTFREVWVEFDSLSMMRALLLLLLVIFFNWLITEGIPVDRISNIFSSSFVPSSVIANAIVVGVCYTGHYFQYITDLQHSIFLSTGLISGALVCFLIIMHWDGISQRWYESRLKLYERFTRMVLFASALVLLSNSFIIEEGASLSFLVTAILGLMTYSTKTLEATGAWLLFGVVMAVTRLYRGCREEQGDCWTSGENVISNQATRAGLILALGSIGIVLIITRRHLGWKGHGILTGGTFILIHWALGWGALGSTRRSRLFARAAWFVIGLTFVLLIRPESQGANIPLSVLILLLYLANSLVLGSSIAPSAGLALLSGYLAIFIVSYLKTGGGSTKYSLNIRGSMSVACMWALLAAYHFYGTGHHATLSHLRWAPAFHAGDPNHFDVVWAPYIIGALVSLELFGMQLMYGAAVPLLALWGMNVDSTVGPRTQMVAVFSLSLKFGLCFAIRVFVSALSATIHCRHLMIWGVFTPKLLFESGMCAAALAGVILGCALAFYHIPKTKRNS